MALAGLVLVTVTGLRASPHAASSGLPGEEADRSGVNPRHGLLEQVAGGEQDKLSDEVTAWMKQHLEGETRNEFPGAATVTRRRFPRESNGQLSMGW